MTSLACACGGGEGGQGPDASYSDARPAGDGSIPMGDAAPMSVADFHSCVTTLDCRNPASECVPVAPLDGSSVCLPSCATSAECPVDTFCYVREDGPYALLKDRCFYSYCGQAFANGETGDGCRLGAEQDLPFGEQVPGWCYPFHDDAWGICLEAGTVPEGGACDGLETRCRGDGCRNCASGLVCVDEICRAVCDPRFLVEGLDTGCGADQGCRDRSELHVYATGNARGSWGTCEPGSDCLTVGENTCPLSEDGQAQGCVPTNPIRATGFCDERGSGELATGATCAKDPPSADPYECMAGHVCVSEPTGAQCEVICDFEMGAAACPEGSSCQRILWSVDPEIATQDWGTCR